MWEEVQKFPGAKPVCQVPKSDPRLSQDIAYIYEIIHCNHFIIHSTLKFTERGSKKSEDAEEKSKMKK